MKSSLAMPEKGRRFSENQISMECLKPPYSYLLVPIRRRSGMIFRLLLLCVASVFDSRR
jgi:hypothetical protein